MTLRARMHTQFAVPLAVALACASIAQAQAPASAPAAKAPAIIKPADNLVADGLPEIPAEIAEAVGRYTEFRSAGFASWHPTKREMLISTRFGDTPQLHEVRFPLGARRQLTFFPDRVGGSSWPRHSADYIVFTKDRGGDEFGQIHRLDVATGAISMLSPGGRSQNGLGPWSQQGDRMAFSSTRRNGTDRDIYVMDPRDAASTRLVLEVKGDFCGQVRDILRRHGREEDYVEVGLDSPYCYNPLHNDLEPYALAYSIASLLNNLYGRGKEPFWQQAYRARLAARGPHLLHGSLHLGD